MLMLLMNRLKLTFYVTFTNDTNLPRRDKILANAANVPPTPCLKKKQIRLIEIILSKQSSFVFKIMLLLKKFDCKGTLFYLASHHSSSVFLWHHSSQTKQSTLINGTTHWIKCNAKDKSHSIMKLEHHIQTNTVSHSINLRSPFIEGKSNSGNYIKFKPTQFNSSRFTVG